jgi:hypothetical protein
MKRTPFFRLKLSKKKFWTCIGLSTLFRTGFFQKPEVDIVGRLTDYFVASCISLLMFPPRFMIDIVKKLIAMSSGGLA